MQLSSISTFRYFTERQQYLQWLADPACQQARRQIEGPIAQLLARGGAQKIFCAAHLGYSEVARPSHAQVKDPNWREATECNVCGAIGRVRLAAEWFVRARTNSVHPKIYVTEQLTPLFKALSTTLPGIVGSEFIPDPSKRTKASAKLASLLTNDGATIRHEDVCALSFPDESFDLVGCFDVLEHVPDYHSALSEFHRVLRSGGQIIITAPFLNGADKTLVRAQHKDGHLLHLETPEYHGNPTVAGGGVLCYYHFGWDLLAQIRAAGFRSAALLDAWGYETGIFGDQNAIVATKC